MADGDQFDAGRITTDTYSRSWYGTDSATGPTNGVWVDTRGVKAITIHFTGGVGTFQLRGSNAPLKPLNTAHAVQIGPDVDVSGGAPEAALTVDVPFRWLKVMVSAYTSGNLFAYMHTVVPS